MFCIQESQLRICFPEKSPRLVQQSKNRVQRKVNIPMPEDASRDGPVCECAHETANIHGSWKKQESSRKTSISVLLTMPKPLCGSQLTVENSERDGNTRPPDLPLEKPICRSGSNS